MAHLGDDVAADAVIQRTADEPLVGKLEWPVLVDGRVADAETKTGDFCGGGGTDIDPKIVNSGCFFLAGVIPAEVDGGISDDAGDAALVTEEGEAAAPGGGGV
jgi:hypothetical protein